AGGAEDRPWLSRLPGVEAGRASGVAQRAVTRQSDEDMCHAPMIRLVSHQIPIVERESCDSFFDVKTPSLDLLRTFLAVHRTGSITAAADLLGLAQPTVTAQVRSLEQLLGRPLFDRLPRGVAPTAAADALARRIAEPLDQIDLVMAEETTDGFLGTVYLGGPAEILTARVLPTLAPLVAEGLRVSVQFGLPDPLLDQLISGRLDLLVVSVRPRRRGLWVEPLYD